MYYDKLDNIDTYKEKIKDFAQVKVEKTKYSIRFQFPKSSIMLNEKGEQDFRHFKLMNKCKNDAERYLKGENNPFKAPIDEILWYATNEYEELPRGVYEPILKIDLNQAYWQKAIQLGIVSKETNQAFLDANFKDLKTAKEVKAARKMLRLRALGSLATLKTIQLYESGKLVDEYPECNIGTRNLYLSICEQVANDIQEVVGTVGGMYYYWDCIFVKVADNKEKKIVQKILEQGYKCTVDHDLGTVKETATGTFFHCKGTDISYPMEIDN